MQALRKLLFPFSLIYGFVVYLRNLFYDKGIFKSKNYEIPLICVGNLSVGGTGKTPMTEFLIVLLQDVYKVAVLSRGYKRKSKGFVLSNKNTKVEDIGDEPFQYHNKFDKINVGVDADRRNGISQVLKLVRPDIILLDDAFQHRKIKAGFNILLTTYNDLYTNDIMLPAGNLRDHRREAKRAEIIVVTKCPVTISTLEKNAVIKKIAPKIYQKVFFSTIKYSEILKSDKEEIHLKSLKNKNFTLVTGIAKPEPLVNYFTNNGFDFEHINFPDHHNFSDYEIKKLQKLPLIITTEKDFVRFNNRVKNLYYIEIKMEFLFDDENEFTSSIKNYIENHKKII